MNGEHKEQTERIERDLKKDFHEHIKDVKDDIKLIKDNHLPHIYEILSQNTTDLKWLKKFFWVIATASIGGLVTAMINLLSK